MDANEIKELEEVQAEVQENKFDRVENSTDNLKQKIGFNLLRGATWIILAIVLIIISHIVRQGIGVISWEFITEPPRSGMTEGGIWPAIMGTVFVTILTAVFSVPVGVFAAIYLNEYAKQGKITRLIRMAIRNLAGVPSVVYGLFGVALFVQRTGFRASILSAGLTLGLLTLPVTITASEEALKAVPNSYRHASLALGVSKWHSIHTNVLPYAIPGILTGAILGLSRAAGETAPILFTGAAFSLPRLPNSLSSQFMALPYHLYIMSTQHHNLGAVRPIAYGTALVLISLILIMNFGAIFIRSKFRGKFKE
ncbi:phosphate ABC transporter permease PstA [Natroniella sulfidigena]|uniref:phosphate ABC transporter permease PstA n=1 Tax=Natroniella sulfidigena TaxID=723921 RepID=UPI00200B9521|nr:phosphate ABC transporter permease PstA [Natroniella sulfidigena]MCK8817772.1 phosphate ABC transporter permease PstA [Natroniella sulfidigena]